MLKLPGHQISLRDWTITDLPLLEHWLQPGHHWQQFDGPYYPKPTAEDISDLLARRRAVIEAGNFPVPRTSLVVAERQQDTLLGQVTWYWESEETNWMTIGIVIYDPARWGKGLGYEALGLWTDYLFTALPVLVRLDLRTWSGNAGMMRLAQKLGYSEEARFRKARIVEGKYYDGMAYGILREEWQARYPQGFAAQLALPPL